VRQQQSKQTAEQSPFEGVYAGLVGNVVRISAHSGVVSSSNCDSRLCRRNMAEYTPSR
jgi:hypothetical protein